MVGAQRNFTPALGLSGLTPLYDRAIRLFTRERVWRAAFLEQIDPQPGERIIDVGCGTGSLAILLKETVPELRVAGMDPDDAVLRRARAKSEAAGVEIEWRRGFARDTGAMGPVFDKAISSLVFHQVPTAEKEAGIAAMVAAVRPGGEVHIADYAKQTTSLMRALFHTIQALDGWENTQANANGAIERLLAAQAPMADRPTRTVGTPTGQISLFRLQTPKLARARRGETNA